MQGLKKVASFLRKLLEAMSHQKHCSSRKKGGGSSSKQNISFATAAKSLQSCPSLYDPIDGSPPGSPVPGILQARTLEWVAISFSNAWKWKVKVKSLSRVQLLAIPWTAAYQAPPSMGFSRQEYWSGMPLPSLNNLHYFGLKALEIHETHLSYQSERCHLDFTY